MILIIDNYDSFTYNLYQYIGEVQSDIRVIRNDVCSPTEIGQMRPEKIVLSPGPKTPEDAGICIEAIRSFGSRIPILGICLGHQCIARAYGAKVSYAKKLMHGKKSMISHREDVLFKGVPERFMAARYHSLSVQPEIFPEELMITAIAMDDGEIMAVRHKKFPVYGLQFHPESIYTEEGRKLIQNFLSL